MEHISCWFMLIMGDTSKIDTIKNNTETLTDASKELGLGADTKKTTYMFMSRHQNVGQNQNIKIALEIW
jgi:hypothetical protein